MRNKIIVWVSGCLASQRNIVHSKCVETRATAILGDNNNDNSLFYYSFYIVINAY